MNELLIKQLRKMGIKNSDTVLIHSALSEIKIDANEIIDTLVNYLDEGLLLMPAHTWGTMNKDNTLFDVNNEPSHVGLLTEIFRKKPGVIRSKHPTHSMSGYGKDAYKYLNGAEDDITPCNPNGALGRLSKRDAYILQVGIGLERSTFIHAVEEILDIDRRIEDEAIIFTIKDNNQLIEKPFRKHFEGFGVGISNYYPRIEEDLINEGILKIAKFGEATVKYYKALELEKYVLKRLKEDPLLFEPDVPLLNNKN